MSFLERKQISKRCSGCIVKKKGLVILKSNTILLKKKGTGDVLFILEFPESEKVVYRFSKFLEDMQINSYQIVLGLQCQPKDKIIPSPMYKVYKNCECIKEQFDCKVIVSVGRSMYSITKSEDLVSWRDFAEFNFNQTYFYTPFYWKQKVRVYPIPALVDWLYDKDNFEKFFTLFQLSAVKNHLQTYSEFKLPLYTIQKVEDPNSFLQENIDQPIISWDLETKHLNHFASDFYIKCITISFDGITGYYLDFDKINKRLLYRFLKDKINILANGKFDIKALYLEGLKGIEMSEDVILLHHCLSTQRINNSIKSLAWLIGFGGYDKKQDEYIEENKIKFFTDIPERIIMPYAVLDAIVTYKLYELGLQLAEKQPEVYKYYKDYLIPVFAPFLEMEVSGMHVNIDYINKLDSELKEKCLQYEQEIRSELKENFDVSSTQQLAKVLEKNNWPNTGRSKKQKYINEKGKEVGFYQVGEKNLEQWEYQGYKLARTILNYRSTAKLRDAFLGSIDEEKEESFFSKKEDTKKKKQKGLIKFIQDDGLLHPTYNPGRTDSLRSSCTSPNIQQLPKQGEEGKIFRPSITCLDDYYIFEADFAGFQLRIAAIYSQDPLMLDIFSKGGDIHSITGQSIFARDVTLEYFLEHKKEEPYKTYRFNSKSVNFGFLFGLLAFTFKHTIEKNWKKEDIDLYLASNNLKIKEVNGYFDEALTVAEDLRTKFFNTYKKLLPWIEGQHKFAMQNGYVDSWHGVRRHLPFLKYTGHDGDDKLINNLKNITVNSPVQAFEAIVAYKGIRKVYDRLSTLNLDIAWMTMVHDSVVFYCHKSYLLDLYYIVKECMEDHTTWAIPITIDVAIGKVWGFGKEVESEDEIKELMKKEC